ncbi:uncharacterized protein A1O5_10502 [Cladophialophora psammophila CBS 110553]|uniref:Transcription initiation factor TFIIA large subunit n=1 Tax=Cladophialophora psammophila CBS 110553 TaxID=1182543 RepID=W9WMZ9_9EURO|nr:uncharacterized protein A1O5_10502 [Cladophialophora psammophila CBS 110553]EXJ66350.1 hypothetical protein A1O5_10502 [Cladophialophora psammophila CBS 110553]
MSKTSVGDVYAKVINDVCEASRQDFEEGGVELATLELLKSHTVPKKRCTGEDEDEESICVGMGLRDCRRADGRALRASVGEGGGRGGDRKVLEGTPFPDSYPLFIRPERHRCACALHQPTHLFCTIPLLAFATTPVSVLARRCGWYTDQVPLQEWQKKLSGLKVAQLPWDPPPVPVIKEQSVVPSSAKPTPQTLPSNGTTVSTPPSQQAAPPAPQIKRENSAPSFSAQQAPPPPQPYQAPSFQQGQPLTARDRAIMNLHQSFGQRAGPQIAQLQSGNPPRAPMQQSAAPSSNYIKQEESNSGFADIQDYTADIKSQPQAAVNASQTDGSCDARDGWETEYARRKAFAAAHGGEGDGLMRAHFQAKQQELEGGGLLMALDERDIPNRALTRNLKTLFASEACANNTSISRAQGDATGDDDDGDDDEDAINSDLDDPDDLAANEENGENTDQVMLCTYDKVQRVKNKWKCTLKDGILRVEGNE